MERPIRDDEFEHEMLEADLASPSQPGPGDSDGAAPADDEPIRDEEDLEDRSPLPRRE